MTDFVTLFTQAKMGDTSAVDALLRMYHPLLCKEAIVNGIFDEDLYQELCLLFLKCVKRFNIR